MSNDRLPGIIYVVSAPSGAGKSTLTQKIIETLPDCNLSVSFTTRPPRENEKEGRDYFFVDRKTFNQMIEEGAFLEHAEVHGNGYGTNRQQIWNASRKGSDVFLDIDVQGAQQIRENLPDAISIFILPPSLQALETRLTARGTETPETVAVRLQNARQEINECEKYDYLIVNDDLERALREFEGIVVSHRLKTARFLRSEGMRGLNIFQSLKGS